MLEKLNYKFTMLIQCITTLYNLQRYYNSITTLYNLNVNTTV